MTHHPKSVQASVGAKPLPVTTFRNSLRSWQAQWKARKSVLTAAAPAGDKASERRGPA